MGILQIPALISQTSMNMAFGVSAFGVRTADMSKAKSSGCRSPSDVFLKLVGWKLEDFHYGVGFVLPHLTECRNLDSSAGMRIEGRPHSEKALGHVCCDSLGKVWVKRRLLKGLGSNKIATP